MARREDREYREYLRNEQRCQSGCPCTMSEVLHESEWRMKAVVAVGNAFCAFSKELVDAFLASTAPAASTARRAADRGAGQMRSAASPGVPGCPCA